MGDLAGLLRKEIENVSKANKARRPYAIAIIKCQQVGEMLLAVATEDGLTECVQNYYDIGYRNIEHPEASEEETLATLREWVRWANPDDGWAITDLDDQQAMAECSEPYRSMDEDESDEAFERDLVSALTKLAPKYNKQGIVLGTTWGEDPEIIYGSAEEINAKQVLKPFEAELKAMIALYPKVRKVKSK